MIFALIPAAGKSTRMGRSKLALPLGEQSVLENVVAALRRAQIEHILVVIGPHVAELAPLARRAGALVLQLSEETPDMRTTVELGLQWLEDWFHPGRQDSWLLIPADHPALSSVVVRQLIQARRSNPESSIVIPTFLGKRGHPALLDWKHVTRLRTLPPGEGINHFLRQCTSELIEIQVESDGILLDLDTPEDYQRIARKRAERRD